MPCPRLPGTRILAIERIGHMDTRPPRGAVSRPQLMGCGQLCAQGACSALGSMTTRSLAPLPSRTTMMLREVQVFGAQGQPSMKPSRCCTSCCVSALGMRRFGSGQPISFNQSSGKPEPPCAKTAGRLAPGGGWRRRPCALWRASTGRLPAPTCPCPADAFLRAEAVMQIAQPLTQLAQQPGRLQGRPGPWIAGIDAVLVAVHSYSPEEFARCDKALRASSSPS